MKKLTIEEMQKIAKSRNGKCLSDKYVNNQTKLLWKCQKGHNWWAVPSNIKNEKWCPVCAGIIKLTIEEMKMLAERHGGECLSDKYINAHTKLKWKCKNNHIWSAVPDSIKRGLWCQKCAAIKNGLNKRLTIGEMKEIAKSRGGECLSDEYRSVHSLLTWGCACGNVWKASSNNVKQGTWCPKCNGNEKLFIEDIKELARKRGGECLSDKYFDIDTKLQWKCDKCAYIWEATPYHIRTGTWCPRCSGNLKKSIEDMKKLAESRGGKCLSNEYGDVYTNLLWECNKCGNRWKATSTNIIRGTWCPKCSGKQKLTIEDMHQIAIERKGQCLSNKYLGEHRKLKWKCEKGHEWEARAGHVKYGSWCPYCLNKGEEFCRKTFEEIFNNKFPIVRPVWLKNPKTGRKLELDGYNKKLKIAFEHQGIQHYGVARQYVITEEEFKKLFYRDWIKKEKCKEKGVKLIVIPQIGTRIKEQPFVSKKNLKSYILSHFTKLELEKINEL